MTSQTPASTKHAPADRERRIIGELQMEVRYENLFASALARANCSCAAE
jgi:hypothetical protein